MAAYRRVYDLRYLQADYQEPEFPLSVVACFSFEFSTNAHSHHQIPYPYLEKSTIFQSCQLNKVSNRRNMFIANGNIDNRTGRIAIAAQIDPSHLPGGANAHPVCRCVLDPVTHSKPVLVQCTTSSTLRTQ